MTPRNRAARKALQDLARDLQANNFEAASQAINAYLAGRASSLDEAFGVAPERRKGDESRDEEARKVLELLAQGKSWPEIEDQLGKTERHWRRALGRLSQNQIEAAKIAERIERRQWPKPLALRAEEQKRKEREGKA